MSSVTPKRVFTSPIASPAVLKSVGISVAISSRIFFIESIAGPVAPVFLVIVSRPSSTSLNAFTAAAPMPTIGAVTCVVRVFPALVTLSPTAFILSPTTFNFCSATEPKSLYSAFRSSSLPSVSAISRCRLSHCSGLTLSFCTDLSIFNRSSVPLIASVKSFCF